MDTIFSNPLLLLIIPGIIFFFWKSFLNLFKIVSSLFITSFYVHSSSMSFDYYLDFFDKYRSDKIRNLKFGYITELRDKEKKGEWYNTLGYGWHICKYKNVWILINHSKSEKGMEMYWETSHIQAFFLTKNLKILNEITKNLYTESSGGKNTKVYINYGDGYKLINTRTKRSVDSVFWNKEVKQELFNDLDIFLKSKKDYLKAGTPYKRAYLFYGIPGTGKTSMASAIAGKYDLNISIINLSTVTDDNQLINLFAQVPNKSLLLLEDIDLIFKKLAENKKPDEKNRITFSGVLNALDGVAYKEGLITIMTTNHIDRIDKAILRDGRIDKKIKVDNISKETALKMVKAYNKTKNDLKGLEFPINPAQLQNILKN